MLMLNYLFSFFFCAFPFIIPNGEYIHSFTYYSALHYIKLKTEGKEQLEYV